MIIRTLAILALLVISTAVSAQKQVKLGKIDTMTFAGFRPGDQLAALTRASFDLDTVFWTGPHGANMFKGIVTLFGQKGECRMTANEGELQQLSFNATFADSAQAQVAFSKFESEIIRLFGEPKEAYMNVHYSIKWFGEKRVLALKTVEGSKTINLTLTKIEAPPVSSPGKSRKLR